MALLLGELVFAAQLFAVAQRLARLLQLLLQCRALLIQGGEAFFQCGDLFLAVAKHVYVISKSRLRRKLAAMV
ncbi:hypothetical protein D3C85_1612290 [compost metagenome]